jgi:hypothetical protein
MLKLAAESPFAGERQNALAAATRLATGHGMTLEEAAAGGGDPELVRPPKRSPVDADTIRRKARDAVDGVRFANKTAARSVHDIDGWHRLEKERFEKAVRDAHSRGLDAEERRRKNTPARPVRARHGGRDPKSHANILLRETSLPLAEICQMTGLDMYQVVGLKLKMRPVAANG